MYDSDLITPGDARAFVAAATAPQNSSSIAIHGTGHADYPRLFPSSFRITDKDFFKLKYYNPEVSFLNWWRGHRGEYRYVYAIEYDVGYTGSWAKFLRIHDRYFPEDLLGLALGWRYHWWAWSRMSPSAGLWPYQRMRSAIAWSNFLRRPS